MATSPPQTFIISDNVSNSFELNPNYSSVLPFKSNGTNVDFIHVSHLTIEEDGNKVVKLINIEPFNSTSTLLTYVIVMNQTMDDTMHLNVTVDDAIIYVENAFRRLKENGFKPENERFIRSAQAA